MLKTFLLGTALGLVLSGPVLAQQTGGATTEPLPAGATPQGTVPEEGVTDQNATMAPAPADATTPAPAG
ncbi:MAG: hypothetical protein KDG89_01415, partial [Geminicoccaceae bacterium]|nr:hypothetical protein [Geminicoccaceae bacterium]